MDKITKLDADACVVFRKEFDAAMKQIEENLGIKVSLGTLIYGPDSVSAKLVFGIDKNINLHKPTEKEWIGLKVRWDSADLSGY